MQPLKESLRFGTAFAGSPEWLLGGTITPRKGGEPLAGFPTHKGCPLFQRSQASGGVNVLSVRQSSGTEQVQFGWPDDSSLRGR